jgi:hypothetical protein
LLCLEAGSILHDSPERSEALAGGHLCARFVSLPWRMKQISLNCKPYGFSFVLFGSGRFVSWAWLTDS